jgi:hypothetical protein
MLFNEPNYNDSFVGVLKDILDEELKLGNSVVETFSGNWPYNNIKAIVLKKTFLSPIRNNAKNILFKNIDDPHYWQSEYFDSENKLLLCCKFDDD